MLLSRRAHFLLVALQLYELCTAYASTNNASEADATCPAKEYHAVLVQESLELCWKNEAPDDYTPTPSQESACVASTPPSVVPSTATAEPVQTSSTETQFAASLSNITVEHTASSSPTSTSTSTSISVPSSISVQELISTSEIQTAIEALPSEPVATSGSSTTEETHSVPDFPSFEEWKRRHLASAAAHKDNKKGGNHTNHTAKGQEVDKHVTVEEKEEKPGKKWSLQKAKDSILGHQAKPAPAVVVEVDADIKFHTDGGALPPATQKILHPVAHAGSGDPALDPLISLRDRTNYASVDCSATLMRASKNIKSASSILSSKKDRYMLTPCSVKEKFVIVELCEEIQIDTIVLANLEFFSSMFKMFRVTAGTSYPESTGTWHEIGTFRASNVRGMQVFRPQDPSRGGFYRYIRVDFLTHYGTEYYCPVSLLKVYGLTNLDAYRRDQEREKLLAEASEEDLLQIVDQPEVERLEDETVYLQLVSAATTPLSGQADSIADADELETTVSSDTSDKYISGASTPATSPSMQSSSLTIISSTLRPHSTASSTEISSTTTSTSSTRLSASVVRTPLTTAVESESSAFVGSTTASTGSISPPKVSLKETQGTQGGKSPKDLSRTSSSTTMVETHLPISEGTLRKGNALISEGSLPSTASASTPIASATVSSASTQREASASTTFVDLRKTSESSVTTPVSKTAFLKTLSTKSLSPLSYKTVATATVQPPSQNRRNETRPAQPQVIYTHPSQPQPNESIYGTIMKRLLALEVNSTLSTAYIEEHTRFVWESFRRIEEKLSGIEHSRGQQDQLLRRIMLDLDLHRARLEAERIELNAQINILSKEMVMEKRLGLIQMAGLVTLLFFVLLTRGSPSTPFLTMPQPRPTATPAFPPRAPRHRPRSLIHQSIDGLPIPMSARETNFRERRSTGPERRNGTASNGASRTASIKRSTRPSGNIRRPPQPPLSAHARSQSEAIASPLAYASTPHSAPLLSLSPSVSRSPPDAPPSMRDPVSHTEGPTTSAVTLQQGFPTSLSTRLGPVESIKRKLRLLQASKNNDTESQHLSPPSPFASSEITTNGDKRRFFKLARRRSTVGSADTEGGKAWQSMSEGSGEEDNVGNIRQSVSSGHMVFMPSPDPSDAEPSVFTRSPSLT